MKRFLAALTTMILLLTVALFVAVASVGIVPAAATASEVPTDIPLDPFEGVDSLPTNPMSNEAYHAVFLYAAKNSLTTVTVPYSIPYKADYQDKIVSYLNDALCSFTYRYPEYFNYLRLISYRILPDEQAFSVILTFDSKGGPQDTEAMLSRREATDARIQEIYQGLYSSGKITDSMPEKERARAILTWVCDNVDYKDDGTLLCHTAYGALENGIAVCDGYSALYQSLLRLDGIRCWGQTGYIVLSNERHHWTVAILDGQQVNIDASWTDSSEGGDKYFAVNDAAFGWSHWWK